MDNKTKKPATLSTFSQQIFESVEELDKHASEGNWKQYNDSMHIWIIYSKGKIYVENEAPFVRVWESVLWDGPIGKYDKSKLKKIRS